jgi:hypothetical protein
MSAQSPTIRESINNGVLQQIADLCRAINLGDLIGGIGQQLFAAGKIQTALFAATGATQALTFAQLGMVPPTDANYIVLASCETTNCRVDESTKTTTGFTLLNTTNLEVINVTIIERNGPLAEQVTVTSSAGTLAAAPDIVLDVIATAGTSLGRKVLKIGDSNLTPAPGEVIWDGATGLRFNATDAVTSAKVVRVPSAGVVTSLLNRALGQQDA